MEIFLVFNLKIRAYNRNNISCHNLVKKFFDELTALGIAQTVFASRMGTIAGKFRMGGKDFARVAGHVQFGNDPDMVLCGKGDDLPDLLFRIESPVQSPLPRKFRDYGGLQTPRLIVREMPVERQATSARR